MLLSKNFSLKELIASQNATRRGIDNSPTPQAPLKLKALAENILQPVRDRFGPTTVTSGYRSPKLNKAVRGSTTSQHSLGEAVDFEVFGVSTYDVCAWIKDNLDFDQLILEGYDPKEGPNSGWIHCSYREGANRKEVLTATFVKGKAVYSRGLNV